VTGFLTDPMSNLRPSAPMTSKISLWGAEFWVLDKKLPEVPARGGGFFLGWPKSLFAFAFGPGRHVSRRISRYVHPQTRCLVPKTYEVCLCIF
jgi:hypothetical protein